MQRVSRPPFQPARPLSVGFSRRPATPIIRVTQGLRQLYQQCNPHVRVSHDCPKRCLTKPNTAVYNNNFDNEQHDYILRVHDILSDVKGNQFIVLDLLGTGTFGQVVKCRHERTGEEVAVKVIKNQRAYFNQAWVEINILRMLHRNNSTDDTKHIVKFHSYFIFREHLCLVFEKLNINLYELLKSRNFRGLSLDMVRRFLTQILKALQVLLRSEVIHCDLKPENILLKQVGPSEVKIIDFGSACQLQHPVYSYVQSRFYRSPEILLGASEYDSKIDMWSLGCVAGELFLGIPLFPGQNEMNMISRIVEMLGDMPDPFLHRCQKTQKFFNIAKADFVEDIHVYQLKSVEQYEHENNLKLPEWSRFFTQRTLRDIILNYPNRISDLSEEEIAQRECLIDLINGMLRIDPRERWTPSEALDHPFIHGNSLPGGRPWTPPTRPRHVMGSRRVEIEYPHEGPSPIDTLYSASAPNYTAMGRLAPNTTWGMGAGGQPVPRPQGFPLFQAQPGMGAFSFGDTNITPSLETVGPASYAPQSRMSLLGSSNMTIRGRPIQSSRQGTSHGNWRGSNNNNSNDISGNGMYCNDQRQVIIGNRGYSNSSENMMVGSTPPVGSTFGRRLVGGIPMSGSRESLTNSIRISGSRESLGMGRVSSSGDITDEMMFPMFSDDEGINGPSQITGAYSHSLSTQGGLSPRTGFGNSAALPPPGPRINSSRSLASSYGYSLPNQVGSRLLSQRMGQQQTKMSDERESMEPYMGNAHMDGMDQENESS